MRDIRSLEGQRLKRWLPCLFFLSLWLAPLVQAEPTVHFDRWYVVLLGEDRAGWAHMQQREAEGRIVSATQMHFTLRRGETTVRIEQASQFVETVDGQPVKATSTSLVGQTRQKQTLRFTESGVDLVNEQAGRTQTRRLEPFEDGWLTPAAAQRHIKARMAAGDEQISVRTVDLTAGPRPYETTMQILGEAEVEVFGRVAPAVVWEAQVSAMPGIRTREYVDQHGRTLKSTTDMMPGMQITMLAADEQLARSEVDPPELLAAMFITPSRPLSEPRALQSAVYRLRFEGDPQADGINLPRAGYQRVTWGDEQTAIVAVDLTSPVNPMDDLPGDADRTASSMIDHEDPKIRQLLDAALGDEADQLSTRETAERLRVFVNEFITEKDLSVGLGTASEVARTGQGDCTEHAVLLAALLRAADIPARTASGLVYVDEFVGSREVFGGHMWTQAWLPAEGGGHYWVDLDATLWSGPFDAAHITLGVSSMSDEMLSNDLVAIVPLLGRLTIEVVEGGE